MPILGAPLDLAKLEARNFRAHQLAAAPASPVTGQLYYNTGDNTLYWYNGSGWVSAVGGVAAFPGYGGSVAQTTFGQAKADGSSPTVSRADHAHGTPAHDAAAHSAISLSALAAPTAAVPWNTQKITGLADGTAATDAATKGQVDAAVQGLDPKASVRMASTGNVTLSGTQTVDGMISTVGDRVLIKDQTTPSQNGIYLAAAGAWTRAADMDSWAEVPGAYVFVEGGSQAETGWVCTSDAAGGTLGTTAINWEQFSGAGQITAGVGLTKTGNTIDVGVGGGIVADASSVAVNFMSSGGDNGTGLLVARGDHKHDSAYIPAAAGTHYYSSATHGAGTSIVITQATHGCRASKGLQVQVQDEATGNVELADVTVTAAGQVTITFGASVAANSKRITIIG